MQLLQLRLVNERNALIFGFFSQAQKKLHAKSRERFSKPEQGELLESIRQATGEHDLTWRAVKERVKRIRDKEVVTRLPGSGRKSTFTPEILEKTKNVSRSFGGDISATRMFEIVSEQVEAPMCGKSTFLRHLKEDGKFKRRHVRYKPSLTDAQKRQRVAFAQSLIDNEFKNEDRIVFVDEKRFEVTSSGTLTLPAEDEIPNRYVQSKTNPVFVMVLVGVMKPRNAFRGIVGMHSFVERVAAARSSKNREKGTIEMKSFNVTKATYVDACDSMFPKLKKVD